MKKTVIFILLIFCILLVSCHSDTTSPAPTPDSDTHTAAAALPLTDVSDSSARYLGEHRTYRCTALDGEICYQMQEFSTSSFSFGETFYADIGNGFALFNSDGIQTGQITIPEEYNQPNTGKTVTPGGNFVVMESLDSPYAAVIDADGVLLCETWLPDTYINGLPCVIRADTDRIYFLQGNYLYLYDTALTLQKTVFFAEDAADGLHITDSGEVVLGKYANHLYMLDFPTSSLIPYPLPALPDTLSDAQVCFGLDGFLYFVNSDGICKMECDNTTNSTPSDLAAFSEILLWSEGNARYRRDLYVLDDDTIFVYTAPSMENRECYCLLTPYITHDDNSRRIVTLGILDADTSGYLSALVNGFNESNDTYYVEVVLYDFYDDFAASYETLRDTFLFGGDVSDMLCLFNAAYCKLISDMGDKNAFVDLTPYFADTVWQGLPDAYTVNGSLSFLPLGIQMEMLSAKTGLCSETLSLEELYTMAEHLQPGQALFSSPYAADTLYEQGLYSFIDYENKSCTFDTEEFRDFIRFTEKVKTDYTNPALGYIRLLHQRVIDTIITTAELQTHLKNDTLLFMNLPLSTIEQYVAAKTLWDDTPFTLCGYPTANGSSIAITGTHFLGITESSTVKGGAAAFMEYALGLSAQTSEKLTDSYLPVTKEAMEILLRKYRYFDSGEGRPFLEWNDALQRMEPNGVYQNPIRAIASLLSENSNLAAYYAQFEEILLTEEEIQSLLSIFDSYTMYGGISSDSTIAAILEEELSAYYAGIKSLETVSALIQSRVWIYLNE